MAGAVVGYARENASATFQDIYVEADLTIGDVRAGIVGRYNDVTERFDLSDVYGSLVITPADLEPHAQAHQLDEANVILPSEVTRAFIEEKFALSAELWDVKDTRLPVLKLASTFLLPKHLVTFVFEEGLEQENITKLVTEGQPLVFVAPEFTGYEYVGLFTDEARTNALPEDFTVTEATTVYVKYDAQTTVTVTFDTLGGPAVESATVNIGSTLEAFPVVANHEFAGVLKEVTGWTLNDEAFTLTTPMNESITLVAVWEVVKHTVTVDGVVQQVFHGEAAVEPDTPQPDELFSEEVYFVRWVSGGTEFDFATPITEDTVITSEMSLPESLTITTPEQLHHALESFSGLTLELANDLDLTTFEWTPITNKFAGVIDGKDHTILGFTSAATGRHGFLPYGNNITIKNLVFDNASVESTNDRSGILIGEVEKGTVTIENVIVKNSNVKGANANGVGSLIGFVKGGATVNINNVAVINTTVHSTTERYAGVLVGRIRNGTVNVENIYSKDNKTITFRTGTNAGSSRLLGHLYGATSSFNAKKVVIDNYISQGDATSGLIGYNQDGGTVTYEDMFIKADLQGVQRSAAIITRHDVGGEQITTEFDGSSVYGIVTGTIENTSSQQLDAENVVTEEELVASFWAEKVTLSDTLWTIPETGIPVLKIAE